MAEYTDADVPMKCAECDLLVEGITAMEQHVMEAHPNYNPQEVKEYVRAWADSTYEEIEAYNMWRTEEFRRTGYDLEEADRDD